MTPDQLNAARYEYVRTLSPVQFADIFRENLTTGRPFDDLVDERRTAALAGAESSAPVEAAPPIGSEAWFNLFDEGTPVRSAAERYIRANHPVEVVHSDETGEWVYAVQFTRTDFWAHTFPAMPEAEAYAAVWNAQCPSTAKPT
jgi:hypothetical protein